jgi:hypothetical protein
MMMQNRIFVVFAFNDIRSLEQFRATKNIDYIADRKLAGMLLENTYNPMDVMELFDEIYSCYLIYELIDPIDEIVMGKAGQLEITS